MKNDIEIAEVVETVRMSLFDQLNALLITPLVKVIMEYALHPNPILISEDYDILKQELPSLHPDRKKVKALFDKIIVLNVQDLCVEISEPGFQLIKNLLIANHSIVAFIFNNTQLISQQENMVLDLLTAVLEKGPRLLSLMTVSELQNKDMQPLQEESEQKLLTILKKDLITSLNLTNTGVRLSKALKAISENKRLGSLVVDGSAIRLYPQKLRYIPKTESIGKILEKLSKNIFLTAAMISSNVIPDVKYQNYQVSLAAFKKKLDDRQDDINILMIRNLKLFLLNSDALIYMPTVLIDLMLGYIYGDFPSDKPMHLQNQEILIRELTSEDSDKKIMAQAIRDFSILDLKDKKITLSDKGFWNLIEVLKNSPIDSFNFNGTYLLYKKWEFGGPKFTWVTMLILLRVLRDSPRPLQFLDLSCMDWSVGGSSGVDTFSYDLDRLFPVLMQPIRFLRLTNYTYTSLQTCQYGSATRFETNLLEFLKKDLVTDLDISKMGVVVGKVLESIKECKNLRSLNLDGNLVYYPGATHSGNTNTVNGIIIKLAELTGLTSINFKYASLHPAFQFSNKDQKKLTLFNEELQQRQGEIAAIVQSNQLQNSVPNQKATFAKGGASLWNRSIRQPQADSSKDSRLSHQR